MCRTPLAFGFLALEFLRKGCGSNSLSGAPSPRWRRVSLQPGDILGERSDLLIRQTAGDETHDARAIIAARAALEVHELLHDVRLKLPGEPRIALRASAVGEVTTDTSRHTAGAVAVLVQHLAAGCQVWILHRAASRRLTGEMSRHVRNVPLFQRADQGRHDGALALAGLVLAQLLFQIVGMLSVQLGKGGRRLRPRGSATVTGEACVDRDRARALRRHQGCGPQDADPHCQERRGHSHGEVSFPTHSDVSRGGHSPYLNKTPKRWAL